MKNKLLENFSMVAIAQLLNYILPFITLPYLISVLGIENYGAYVVSQAIITYLMIFIDFGFDIYATREVSINRHNKSNVEQILSSVLFWKISFLLISFIALLIATITIPALQEFQTLHLMNFGMVVGIALLTSFYYQGIESMKYITIFNASAKIFFTALIFVFVKDENDLVLTAIINSSGYLIVGFISIYIIFVKHKMRFVRVAKNDLIKIVKDSASFFWSRVAVSIYTTSNTVVIGMVLGNAEAAIFNTMEKIFRAIVSMYGAVNTVLYPYISYKRDIPLYKKILKLALSANVVFSIVLIFSSSLLVQLFLGEPNDVAKILLFIFAIALIYTLPSVLIGYPLLGAFGYLKVVNYSVIIASILHIGLIVSCIPIISIELVAGLVAITELIVFVIRYYYVKKYKILKEG